MPAAQGLFFLMCFVCVYNSHTIYATKMSNKIIFSTKKKMSQDSSDEPVRKQSKLNSKNPMTGRVFEVASSDEEDSGSDDDVVALPNQNSHDADLRTILLASIKHKKLIEGAGFIEIMNHTIKKSVNMQQKLRAKLTKQKNVISKLCLKGIRSPALNSFLSLKHTHLNMQMDYVQIATNVCRDIMDILVNECAMTDVDLGILMDYFNAKFSDVRNQNNTDKKKRVKKEKKPAELAEDSKPEEKNAKKAEGKRKAEPVEPVEPVEPKKVKRNSPPPRKQMPANAYRKGTPSPISSPSECESASEDNADAQSSDDSSEKHSSKSLLFTQDDTPPKKAAAEKEKTATPTKKKAQAKGKTAPATASGLTTQAACSSSVSAICFVFYAMQFVL